MDIGIWRILTFQTLVKGSGSPEILGRNELTRLLENVDMCR